MHATLNSTAVNLPLPLLLTGLQFCYLAEYKGSERGVLVQLGQGPMLGHFPLGLFDEAMSNPEPAMKPTPAPAASGSGGS